MTKADAVRPHGGLTRWTNSRPMWGQVLIGGVLFFFLVAIPALLVSGSMERALIAGALFGVFGLFFFGFAVVREKSRRR